MFTLDKILNTKDWVRNRNLHKHQTLQSITHSFFTNFIISMQYSSNKKIFLIYTLGFRQLYLTKYKWLAGCDPMTVGFTSTYHKLMTITTKLLVRFDSIY
jgi:hypothetical protein